MEKYNLDNDVKVFGVHVKTFPQGIGEAFDGLVKMLPPADERPYYGISKMTSEGFIYNAAALETFVGEAEKYGCESYIIEKGEYLAVTLMDWPKKTENIKEVFKEIFKDEQADCNKPCIEVYKNMEEMLCMVKVDQSKKIITGLETGTNELLQVLSTFNQEQMNAIPFEGSWTAAQVAQHVHMSDTGILEIVYGPVKSTERNAGEKIEKIKTDLLDFTVKTNSPEFVLPAIITYQKEKLVNSLLSTREKISEAAKTLNLSETCSAFSFPGYGELTRLESIGFIIYHTQRHIHQLKNILKTLKSAM